MDDVLKIRWNTGYMNINMQKFFPCSIAKLNKLLKVIRLDWEHEQELLAQMQTFFSQRLIDLDAEYKKAAKCYGVYYQKEADSRRLVESRKFPNGIPMTKDDLQKARDELKRNTEMKREYEKQAKKAKKDMEWFRREVTCNG